MNGWRPLREMTVSDLFHDVEFRTVDVTRWWQVVHRFEIQWRLVQ